jgi:hypothetical protein
MNAVRIAKLEALLARVTTRAAQPRAPRAPIAAAPIAAAPIAAAPIAAAATPHFDDVQELPTRPPAAIDFEVDLPEPAVELTPRPHAVEVAARGPQSDQRIVAAKPIEADEELAAAGAVDDLMAADIDEMPVEAAPSSSPRPLGPPPGEVLEEQAFGADAPAPALHTPPPESGRLPAVPELTPVVEAADYENQDITGVHHTPGAERRRRASETPSSPPRDLMQSGEHSALSPEVTRAATSASAAVAHVIDRANAFKPATFAELLDATLAL